MASSDNNRVKCKFCDWSTLRVFKTRSGRLNYRAYERLKEHMEDEHWNELCEIEDRLEKEFEEKVKEEEKVLDFLM